MAPPPLPLEAYRDLVSRALAEDIGAGDVTTELTVDVAQRARGVLLAKSTLVLAGLDVAHEVFRQLDEEVVFRGQRRDGESCAPGTVIADVTGRARALLTAERTALNFLQRLSGIATETRRYVEAAGGALTVLDTRKTTPTLRRLEKYAVHCGGGTNHRQRLDDAILIKDNHIRLAGGVKAAIERMRGARRDMPIEIEVQSLEQLQGVLESGAETILLDNLSTEQIREGVRRIGGRAKIEISGGITLERIPELAATGADYVSVGALTHSAPASDISLEIEPDP